MAKEKKEIAEKTPASDNKTNDREYLIRLATNFLANPKTQAGSKESKIKFLKDKGLKPDEIEKAFENAEKKKKEEEEEKAGKTASQQAAPQGPVVVSQGKRTGTRQLVLAAPGK
jgi:SOS response regulatory protein OraA/RecX